jgi:hypothetical protein
MTRRLIVFARAPLPGEAKTRLADAIGETAAAGVYARMLYGYLLELATVDWEDVAVQLSVASAEDVAFFAEAFPEIELRAQPEGDLGMRLAAAFDEAFAGGARSVVVTASDTPELDVALIHTAFRTLEQAPAVIGPCPDGGYYLLGMRAPGTPLFEGVDWGTDRVLEQTERLARAAGLTMARLPERMDVDTGDDLIRWRRTQRP